MNSYKKRTHKL